MAFTPSENPITNPTRESYTELRPFRFWCQKVLPLVYDDSLSYYELLCKVVDYLNKTMEDVDHMNTDMDTLYSNFQEFQEGTIRIYNELVAYVNAYFENLDVQEEINNKLDEMVTSGELVTILQPSIADEVASWLTEHITPTTPAIDDTLTVQGAGADAKVVGDKFKKVVQDITSNSTYTDANDINENCFIFNSSSGGVLTIANTPNYAGWLQTNYINNNIVLQTYYSWGFNYYSSIVAYRNKTFNGWTDWRGVSPIDITQHRVDNVNGQTGDLNDYIENCFTFIGSPNTIANMPQAGAGVLFVNNFNTITYQMFVSFVEKTIYARFKVENTWNSWVIMNDQYFNAILSNKLSKVIQDITSTSTYTDANNITENCFIFNSSSGGVLTIANTPNYPGWLQTNYTIDDIIMQIYYPWTVGQAIKYRNKTFDGWDIWHTVSGNTYTKNITENTIENTYTITTYPQITTDTHGWLVAIDDKNTSESNATDMSGAIISMLEDTGYCHLSEGVFFVSGNIDMPEGSLLEGCGEKTVIKLLNSSTNAYICRMHTKSTIKNVRFCGSFSDIDLSNSNIGGRTGIAYIGNRNGEDTGITPSTTTCCIIDCCWFDNLDNGIYCHNSGGGLQEGLICNDCYITQCKCGINIDYWSEYSKFTNVVIFKCYYACINNGGNNVFTSCTFHGTIGFLIDNSLNDKPNNAHGSVIGCTFNHIDNWNRPDTLGRGIGIKIVNTQNGFIFTGCQMFYGSIEIENGKGIQFSNFLFGGNSNTYTIDSNTPVFFNDCTFLVAPDLTNVSANTKFSSCYNANTGELITI